jgi:hypothetical protein
MKKLGIVQLEKLQGGMTCQRMGEIIDILDKSDNPNQQGQASYIRLLLSAGFTLCEG